MADTSPAERIATYETQLTLSSTELARLRAGRLVLEQEAIVAEALEQYKHNRSNETHGQYGEAMKELRFREQCIQDIIDGDFMGSLVIAEFAPLEREYITQQIEALEALPSENK